MQTVDGEQAARPTGIRYQIIGWATVMSLLLYLDRFCISICTGYIQQDLNVSPKVVSLLSTAFFFAYALGQVPAGWLTDRFGVRLMLSVFILGWSACTGLQAFAQSFALLAILQLCCGMMQAGAYPAGARLIRDWNPPVARGIGSAMVALGGRVGGALAPVLTAMMLVFFVPTTTDSHVSEHTVLKSPELGRKLNAPPVTSSKPKLGEQQIAYLQSLMTATERSLVADLAQIAEDNAALVKSSGKDAVQQTASADQTQQLREMFNRLIDLPDFYRADLFDDAIEREGKQLSQKQKALNAEGKDLSPAERERMHRLALEAVLPKIFGNIYVHGWRPSMLVYGLIGVVIAGVFWLQVRNSPQGDTRCNASERRLIEFGNPPVSDEGAAEHAPFPWVAMLTNVSLWGNCLLQFTTNVGWVFLVRTMPQYLDEVHGVSLVARGWMTSMPIWTGVIAVFYGGRLTDWLGQKIGLKWGRRLPILVTRVTAALGYGLCIALSLLVPKDQAPEWMPWVYVAALCLVAVSTDIGVPSVWAFMQDVGGKYTASVLGWGNMWGNFGAAAATPFYAWVITDLARQQGWTAHYAWNVLFALLGGAFLLGAAGTMLMDSSKPLVPVPESTHPV